MRKRSIQVKLYLNEDENRHLCELSERTCLSKSRLIRYLLQGYIPPVPPPVEYRKLIKELRMIGSNINQMLVIARCNGILNTAELQKHLDSLDNIEDEMREAFDFKKRDKRWQ